MVHTLIHVAVARRVDCLRARHAVVADVADRLDDRDRVRGGAAVVSVHEHTESENRRENERGVEEDGFELADGLHGDQISTCMS